MYVCMYVVGYVCMYVWWAKNVSNAVHSICILYVYGESFRLLASLGFSTCEIDQYFTLSSLERSIEDDSMTNMCQDTNERT